MGSMVPAMLPYVPPEQEAHVSHTYTRKRSDPIERFCSKIIVDLETHCWIFKGTIAPNGYGRFVLPNGHNGKIVPAHVFIYEQLHGPVLQGYQLHHICHQRACVNPDHLQPLTPREHTDRHRPFHVPEYCTKGHAMTPDNTKITKRNTGVPRWNCRACGRQWAKESRARKKATRA